VADDAHLDEGSRTKELRQVRVFWADEAAFRDVLNGVCAQIGNTLFSLEKFVSSAVGVILATQAVSVYRQLAEEFKKNEWTGKKPWRDAWNKE